MKKKLFSVFLLFFFVLFSINKTSFVSAEETDCEGLDGEEYDACLVEKAKELNSNIQDIRKQIEEAEGNLEEARSLATKFAQEASQLQSQIDELNVQITELKDKIDVLEKSIAENEEKVEELNERVMGRMVEAQKTMHFNPFLDFILGSKDFDDLLRRIYGVEAIASKEKEDRTQLIEILTKLDADKKELDASFEELDGKKQELVNAQAEYIVMRDYWHEVEEETEAEIEAYQNSLESMRSSYSDILSEVGALSGLPTSEGFLAAVPGASISAGVWHYPASFGGGVHLGMDYAVGRGTAIVAPANGIIIVSYQGCNDPGYLGCACGGDGRGNGVSYGGNQVYLVCSVYDQVYAFTFSHLHQVAVQRGQIVMAGDTVGYVGSSGNSTGPHCHIEMYYLGPGTMEDIESDYLNRGYSTSFNCGWGSAALNRLCENGVGAPCRLNPANYLGG